MRLRLVIGLMLLGLVVPAGAHAADAAWTRKALDLQYELASDVPLRNAPWVYTHNSYNSAAEMGLTVSNRDANHTMSLVAQLDEGVRSLEIDTHLFLNAQDPRVGLRSPVVCHARGADQGHAGCSVEKPLLTVLGEVRAWLDRHPRQVLLLYLESHLESDAGYGAGADVIAETLANKVYRPSARGGSCQRLPLALTRDRIRAAGKQVLLMGPCGEGGRWRGWVHDESPRETGGDNATFRDYPDCGPEFKRAEYDSKIIRFYEDATQLSRTVNGGIDPIDATLTARMARCGVDLVGFDFLVPGDPRLAALVWSWAPGQPAGAGACSIQRADGRWESRPCAERHRVACRDWLDRWFIPRAAVKARSSARVCASARVVNGLPRTGYEGQRLRTVMKRLNAGSVWLGQRRRGNDWARFEKHGCGPTLVRPRKRRPVRDGVARLVVKLRFACTGERLRGKRRVLVHGGVKRVRTRAGRRTRVPVAEGTSELKVRFRYAGKTRVRTLLLRGG